MADDEDFEASAAADRDRRRAAKLWNERLKAFVTFLNGLGIVLFVAVAITLPGARVETASLVGGILAALTLHGIAQLVLTLWRSED